MYDIVGSIVTFKNSKDDIKKAIVSFLNSRLNTYLYIIDNSPADDLRDVCVSKNVEYIFNNNNLGFGAGHNIAIRKASGKSRYSLILNPDVYFEGGTLERLFDFMEQNPAVGLAMPKVLYPDGSLQDLCKLLPNPCDMFFRKANIRPLNRLLSRKRLNCAGFSGVTDVPYLSGCFMFIRSNIFRQVGLFDERFFIHFEDLDLTRRIHELYRTVYYPQAWIYHKYERSSNKDPVVFKHLVCSGIKYFNKWGWFFDKERKNINNKAMKGILASDD
ncbi:MAG: glycosyltransferase family 2 protein [Candidatus Omnitrophica bacterium]|nr:glycosyltransferase family 2 protein [Candidatus Omnitrophota bacterium]